MPNHKRKDGGLSLEGRALGFRVRSVIRTKSLLRACWPYPLVRRLDDTLPGHKTADALLP